MRAIQVTEFGGPEVLTLAEVAEPKVADGMIPVARPEPAPRRRPGRASLPWKCSTS